MWYPGTPFHNARSTTGTHSSLLSKHRWIPARPNRGQPRPGSRLAPPLKPPPLLFSARSTTATGTEPRLKRTRERLWRTSSWRLPRQIPRPCRTETAGCACPASGNTGPARKPRPPSPASTIPPPLPRAGRETNQTETGTTAWKPAGCRVVTDKNAPSRKPAEAS